MEPEGNRPRPLRIGLIGCGRMARKHIRTMASLPEVELAAVSDVAAERMEEAARLYREEAGRNAERDTAAAAVPAAEPGAASQTAGEAAPGIRKFASYEELLASPDVDAVVIATSSALHAEAALKAIRAGRPVMVEKPLALSLRDAELIRGEAERFRVPVLVCHQLRYRPLFRRLKRAIDGGGFGNILYAAASLRIRRDDAYYAAAPWRGKWELDGGMLINQGIHLIDLMLWFLGEPRQVSGELMRLPGGAKETEDAALAAIRFSSGAVGWFDANVLTYPNTLEQSLYICGTKGTVAVGGPALDRILRWHVEGSADGGETVHGMPEAGTPEPGTPVPVPDSDGHPEMYLDFVRAVRTGGQPLVNAAEGTRALGLIFALYQSHLEGRAVGRPRGDFSPTELNAAEVWNR